VPIYEYRCENGHLFDVMQRMSDDPLTACIECGAAVQKVLNAPAIHFKGSGFYNTDYGRRNGSKGSEGGAEGGKGAGDAAASTAGGSTGSSSSSSSSSTSSSTGSGSSASGGSSSSKSD
jgi:putative FmdB family regulatory protein